MIRKSFPVRLGSLPIGAKFEYNGREGLVLNQWTRHQSVPFTIVCFGTVRDKGRMDPDTQITYVEQFPTKETK